MILTQMLSDLHLCKLPTVNRQPRRPIWPIPFPVTPCQLEVGTGLARLVKLNSWYATSKALSGLCLAFLSSIKEYLKNRKHIFFKKNKSF